MNFRPINLLVLLIILTWAVTACSDQFAESRWTNTPVSVDGRWDDSENYSRKYFRDAGVLAGMCNDDKNLYIFFQFNDPQLLRAASGKGFKLWFDKDRKRRKSFGIRYLCNPPIDSTGMMKFQDRPEMRSQEMPPGMPPGQQGQMDRGFPGQRRNVIEQIVVLHDPDREGISIRPDGSNGPKAALGNDNGVYVYEFSVPIGSEGSPLYSLEAEPGDRIKICFEFGGMDRGDMPERGMGGKGGRGGFSGGPPGGNMGGGPPGGGGGMGGGAPGGGGGMGGPPGQMGGERGNMMNGSEIWIDATLASVEDKTN